MGTDWKDTQAVADGFESYDDLPERVIGYPTVFRELGLAGGRVRTVLDYGCGPGKVALRAVRRYDVAVVGVDISPHMLELAGRLRGHPRITYRPVGEGQRLPFLTDGAVDAALSCYVFINIGDLDVIRAIAAEVYRVLSPGGRYTVLDTHPETTGIRFSTFVSGEPGRVYAPGERRRVVLHQPTGQTLTLTDHHWPRHTYAEVLTDAGFTSVTFAEPRLGDVPDRTEVPGSALDTARPAEAVDPPFLIVTGVK